MTHLIVGGIIAATVIFIVCRWVPIIARKPWSQIDRHEDERIANNPVAVTFIWTTKASGWEELQRTAETDSPLDDYRLGDIIDYLLTRDPGAVVFSAGELFTGAEVDRQHAEHVRDAVGWAAGNLGVRE